MTRDMYVDTKTLVNKLNPICKRALESAAALCVSKTHYNVELEHFLLRLLETGDSDIAFVLRHYELDAEAIQKQLLAALEKLQTGNTGQVALSPHILTTLEEA